MMKTFLIFLVGVLFLSSCYKEEITPQQPIVQPTITDSTFVDTPVSIANTTWVVTKVLNTDMSYELRSDTLVFTDSENYTFNGIPSKYGFNTTPTAYKLTLYNTPWGNIGGSLLNYNIDYGTIDGKDFYDIFDSNIKVKLWVKKL